MRFTLAILLATPTLALRSINVSRRGAIGLAAGGLAAINNPAIAAEPSVAVYFGAGCFWHVQHEMVIEEQKKLKRTSEQITAVSGYAGGQRAGDGGRLCYHNPRGVADYGRLGHAEAVQVNVPVAALPVFAKKYFSLFGSLGVRHDPQDAGGEYRSVLGLPGGMNSQYMDVFREAANDSPMTLVAGRGDDGDTIRDKSVLVYDSKTYPFYAAELYHQFHDDFMGSPYGKAYNMLNPTLYKTGVLRNTGCPEPPAGFPKNPYV